MTTKHAPATPLPGMEGFAEEQIAATRFPISAENAEKDRRANAYPLLVEALHAVQRDCHTRSDLARETMESARALLRSLGEDA